MAQQIYREISGNYNLADLISTRQFSYENIFLLCNTSSAPVNIQLPVINTFQGIDNGFLNAKIKIIDVSGAALSNNITITAGSGNNINGLSSIILNSNNCRGVLELTSLTTWMWTGTVGGQIQAFDNDTGWVPLDGFAWMAAGTNPPAYRCIGRRIFFRGNLVVPLMTFGMVGIQSFTSMTAYDGLTSQVAPAVGAGVGSVLTDANGNITFNSGDPVISVAARRPDTTYTNSFKLGFRRLNTSGAAKDFLTSIGHINITSSGVLSLNLLKSMENPDGLGLDFHSGLRFIVSNVRSNDFLLDFNAANGGAGTGSIHGTTEILLTESFLPTAQRHQASIDAGLQSQVGGFIFNLNELQGCIDVRTPYSSIFQ